VEGAAPGAANDEAGEGEVAPLAASVSDELQALHLREDTPPSDTPADPTLAEGSALLQTAATRAQEDDGCVVCMERAATHAFAPCGHQCVCKACADRITGRGGDGKCPCCRTEAFMAMPIYKS